MDFKVGDWVYYLPGCVNGVVVKTGGVTPAGNKLFSILWEDGLYSDGVYTEGTVIVKGKSFDLSKAFDKSVQLSSAVYTIDNLTYIEIYARVKKCKKHAKKV